MKYSLAQIRLTQGYTAYLRQWGEVGTPKKGGQKDPAGRDRLQNDKSKSFYK